MSENDYEYEKRVVDPITGVCINVSVLIEMPIYMYCTNVDSIIDKAVEDIEDGLDYGA